MTTPVMNLDRIQLPEGYTMRPVHLEDMEAALEVFNACSIATEGYAEFTIEDLEHEWNLETFDLERSTRAIFTPEGKLVGYGEIWDLHDIPVHPWTWSRVHPDYQGLGIGTAIRAWIEQRAYDVFDRCPADARISIYAGVKTGDAPAEKLMESIGMKAIRHNYRMRIEQETKPVYQIPEGFTVRTMNYPDDLADVALGEKDSFKDHFGYIEAPIESMIKRYRDWIESDPKFDPSLWFLAYDQKSGEIAGISLCSFRPNRDGGEMGWVNTLGVRRPFRKVGLGRALLLHSFAEFWKRGFKPVGLGVDGLNLTGALRLYQGVGMKIATQNTFYEKELRPGKELATTEL